MKAATERRFIRTCIVGTAAILVVFFALNDARLNNRIDRMSAELATKASKSAVVVPASDQTLAGELKDIKKTVDGMQSERGLTAEQVRGLIETLLPVIGAPPPTTTTSTSTPRTTTTVRRPTTTVTVTVPTTVPITVPTTVTIP